MEQHAACGGRNLFDSHHTVQQVAEVVLAQHIAPRQQEAAVVVHLQSKQVLVQRES